MDQGPDSVFDVTLDCSESNFAALTVANPDRIVSLIKEYLAVADFAGEGALHDRINRGFDTIVAHHNLHLQFRQQVYVVLTATVGLRLAFLPAMSSYLRYRHSLHSQGGERFSYLVKPVGPDDRF
jgi:hypothetical protein